MREAGSWPVSVSRSVLSTVTRAVTLTTESLGSPEDAAGRKTLPGMAARPVPEVMTAAMVVFRRLALNGPDWMTRTGRRLAGLLPRVSPRSAHQMLPRWITSRPGGPGGCARLRRQRLRTRRVRRPGALRRFAG